MNIDRRIISTLALLFFAITPSVQARNNGPAIGKKFSEWTLGPLVSGEAPTSSYIKKKVIVLAYWGIQ